MKKLLLLLLLCSPANAQVFDPVPYTFVANTTVVPNQLMGNFLSLVASGNAVASNLNFKVTSLGAVPTGALLLFNLGACPSGWTVSVITNQLFIRGLDSGAGNDITGTALGATETGGMQDHTHSSTILTGYTILNIGSVSIGNLKQNPSTASAGATGNPITGNHGAEVRPANVSLLLCSKN